MYNCVPLIKARKTAKEEKIWSRGKVKYFSGALFLSHTIDGADRELYNGSISLWSLLRNEAQSCLIVKWHFRYRQGQNKAYVATWDTQRLTLWIHPPAITSHTNSCHLASHSSFYSLPVSCPWILVSQPEITTGLGTKCWCEYLYARGSTELVNDEVHNL